MSAAVLLTVGLIRLEAALFLFSFPYSFLCWVLYNMAVKCGGFAGGLVIESFLL